MAGHELIARQLALLTARLPASAAEELADGLRETYESRLEAGEDPERAARSAIAEFGDADTVTAAFISQSAWRRMAVLLLATGPVMGAVWGLGLVSAQVWTWPIGPGVRAAYGLALLTVVALLATAVLERRSYRRARASALLSATGLVVLDAAMLTAIATLPAISWWPLAAAVPASLIRIVVTVRALPPALAH